MSSSSSSSLSSSSSSSSIKYTTNVPISGEQRDGSLPTGISLHPRTWRSQQVHGVLQLLPDWRLCLTMSLPCCQSQVGVEEVWMGVLLTCSIPCGKRGGLTSGSAQRPASAPRGLGHGWQNPLELNDGGEVLFPEVGLWQWWWWRVHRGRGAVQLQLGPDNEQPPPPQDLEVVVVLAGKVSSLNRSSNGDTAIQMWRGEGASTAQRRQATSSASSPRSPKWWWCWGTVPAPQAGLLLGALREVRAGA
jgi:hypothetical protein